MPKTDDSFDPEEYAPVAQRIALFYERFPQGRIITKLVSHSEIEIVFKAVVYRTSDETRPAATGWASERIGDGDVNTVACLENTETSAVGRALANLGLTAARQRPSREEMEKAARARSALKAPPSGPTAGRLTRVVPAEARVENVALQHAADRITDLMQLVHEAERAGMPAARAQALRERVTGKPLPEELQRLERALRRWVRRRITVPHPGDRATEPYPEKPPF